MTLVSIGCIFKVFIKGTVIFIGKGNLAIKGRSFKTAEAKVNRHDLRQ